MNIFNTVAIEKYKVDPDTGEYVPRARYLVPVQYATRDKTFDINTSNSARKTMPPEDSLAPVEMQLIVPRIAVNLTGIVYDSDRHQNKLNQLKLQRTMTQTKAIYMPTPYNLEIELTAVTKTMDDANQILEQIVPFFGPSISLDINTFQDITESIPVVLTSVTFDFPTELPEDEDRLYQISFFFSIRANYYRQTYDATIIQHVTANVIDNSDGGGAGDIGNVIETVIHVDETVEGGPITTTLNTPA